MLVHKGVGDARYGRDFALRYYRIHAAKIFASHFQKCAGAVYILSGRCTFEDDEENSYEVGPGDVIYTYTDEPHGATVSEEGPCEMVCCINCLGDKSNCDPEKQAQIIQTK